MKTNFEIINSVGLVNLTTGREIAYRLKFMFEHKGLVKQVPYSYFKMAWKVSQPVTGNKSTLSTHSCNVELLITNKVRTKEKIYISYTYDHDNDQVLCWMSSCADDPKNNELGYMFVIPKSEFGRPLTFMGTGIEDREALVSNKKYLSMRSRVINELIQSKFYLGEHQKLSLINLGAYLVRGGIGNDQPLPNFTEPEENLPALKEVM